MSKSPYLATRLRPGERCCSRSASHRASSLSRYNTFDPALIDRGPMPRDRQLRNVLGVSPYRSATSLGVHSFGSNGPTRVIARLLPGWFCGVRTTPQEGAKWGRDGDTPALANVFGGHKGDTTTGPPAPRSGPAGTAKPQARGPKNGQNRRPAPMRGGVVLDLFARGLTCGSRRNGDRKGTPRAR